MAALVDAFNKEKALVGETLIIYHSLIQGDSGGPLSYESNGQHVLIGATNFGLGGCANVVWNL